MIKFKCDMCGQYSSCEDKEFSPGWYEFCCSCAKGIYDRTTALRQDLFPGDSWKEFVKNGKRIEMLKGHYAHERAVRNTIDYYGACPQCGYVLAEVSGNPWFQDRFVVVEENACSQCGLVHSQ